MQLPPLEVLEIIREVESESLPVEGEKDLEANIYRLLRKKGHSASDSWVVAKATALRCRALIKKLKLRKKSRPPIIN